MCISNPGTSSTTVRHRRILCRTSTPFRRLSTAGFFSFRLRLITDPSNPARLAYPGSTIWRRQSLLFFGLFEIPSASFNYDVVQIINGDGNPIEPAYGEWVEWVKTNTENKIAFDRLADDRVEDFVEC